MAKKKISKVFEGEVLVITVGEKEMRFDTTTVPEDIKDRARLHGFSQKLGDSAASAETNEEIINAISKTWEALVNGEWTTRLPAGEKITKKGLLEKFAGLSPNERAVAEPLMKKLGLI